MLVFLYIVLAYVAAFLLWVSGPIIKKQLKSRFGTINQITFAKSPNYKRNIKRMKVIGIFVRIFMITFLFCLLISLFQANTFATVLTPIALLAFATIRVYYLVKIRKIVINYKKTYPFGWIKAPKFRLYICSIIASIIICIIEAIIGPMVITSQWADAVNNLFSLI